MFHQDIKKNNMQEILKQYPSSSMNNARSIIRKKLEKMRDYPSEQRASELEDKFGIVCDWSDKDHGEGPKYQEENNN